MLYLYLGEGGECEVVRVDLPEEPVVRLVVVRRLVVPLIREPGPLRLQRLRLQLRLKGQFTMSKRNTICRYLNHNAARAMSAQIDFN